LPLKPTELETSVLLQKYELIALLNPVLKAERSIGQLMNSQFKKLKLILNPQRDYNCF